MNEEEMKKLWQEQSSGLTINPELVKEIERQIREFDTKIKWRDRLEIGVALLLVPFLLFLAAILPFTLAKLGATLTAISMLFIVFVLKKNQKKSPETRVSITEHIEAEMNFLKRQRSLLTNVLYWYLLPPAIGISLFFYGMKRSDADFYWNEGIVILIIAAIWYVNRQVVKKEINPSLQALQAFLKKVRRK